jgi:hypothetical protein
MGWKAMLPLALTNVVVTAAVVVLFSGIKMPALIVASIILAAGLFFVVSYIIERGVRKLVRERPVRAAERRMQVR